MTSEAPSSSSSFGSGWQARCSGCDKIGEYIVPNENDDSKSQQTSYKQHNEDNKYCGEFKLDPQQVSPTDESSEMQQKLNASDESTTATSSKKDLIKTEQETNFMLADCSGCGKEGEYWVRLYRDQNYHRIHLVYPEGGGPTAGKFCGNYSENPRWLRPVENDNKEDRTMTHTSAGGAKVKTGTKKNVSPREVKEKQKPTVASATAPAVGNASSKKRKQSASRSRPSKDTKALAVEDSPSNSSKDDDEDDDDGEEEAFTCGTCGRQFVSELRLSDHQRRSLSCTQENKRSIRRTSRELREAAMLGDFGTSTPSPTPSSSSPKEENFSSGCDSKKNNDQESKSSYDVAAEVIAPPSSKTLSVSRTYSSDAGGASTPDRGDEQTGSNRVDKQSTSPHISGISGGNGSGAVGGSSDSSLRYRDDRYNYSDRNHSNGDRYNNIAGDRFQQGPPSGYRSSSQHSSRDSRSDSRDNRDSISYRDRDSRDNRDNRESYGNNYNNLNRGSGGFMHQTEYGRDHRNYNYSNTNQNNMNNMSNSTNFRNPDRDRDRGESSRDRDFGRRQQQHQHHQQHNRSDRGNENGGNDGRWNNTGGGSNGRSSGWDNQSFPRNLLHNNSQSPASTASPSNLIGKKNSPKVDAHHSNINMGMNMNMGMSGNRSPMSGGKGGKGGGRGGGMRPHGQGESPRGFSSGGGKGGKGYNYDNLHNISSNSNQINKRKYDQHSNNSPHPIQYPNQNQSSPHSSNYNHNYNANNNNNSNFRKSRFSD